MNKTLEQKVQSAAEIYRDPDLATCASECRSAKRREKSLELDCVVLTLAIAITWLAIFIKWLS